MAFSNSAVHLGEIKNNHEGKNASALATALSVNCTSISAIGDVKALGQACFAFIKAWRSSSRQAGDVVSANKVVSVDASSTTTAVTVKFTF